MNILESIYHICTSNVGANQAAAQLAKADNRAPASALSQKEQMAVYKLVGKAINGRLTAQEDLLKNRFRGYRLALRSDNDSAVGMVTQGLTKGRNVAKSSSKAETKLTADKAEEWMEGFIEGMGVPSELVGAVNNTMLTAGNATLQNAIGASLPFIGIFFSLCKAAECGQAVYEDMNDRSMLDKNSKFALPGTPAAAMQALRTLLTRELAFDAANAARSFTVVGSQIAGLITDLGVVTNTAISVANAGAEFMLDLGRLVMIAKQVAIGNKILERTETLSMDVFEQCPILGCYYLQAAQAMNLIDIYFEADGTVNEAHRKEAMDNMEPILNVVESFIEKSNTYLAVPDGAPTSIAIVTRT
jgi:hypothetical protein